MPKRLVCQSFVRVGYYISGWSTTKNGSTAYTYNQQVTNLTAAQNGNIHLYAVWVKGNVSIMSIEDEMTTFSLTSGENTADNTISYTKTYSYDLAGNRTGFTLEKSGETVHNVTYSYDNLNRLSIVSENGAIEATYTYDTNGNRATLTLGNGVVTTYSYNLANWVTNLSNKNSDGEILSSYSYEYYVSSNQKCKTENGAITNYVYDDLGRLTSESEADGVTLSYTYDSAGNRSKLTATGTESYVVDYTYDNANHLLTEVKIVGGATETTTYTYDANGNTLSVMSPGSIQVNEYNLFNQLVATNANGTYAAYSYNANGIRTAKSVNGTSTSFLLDGGKVVGKVVGNDVITIYLRGANLLSTSTDNETSYYLFNAHGDVTGIVGESEAVIKSYDYDAFGNEKEPSENDQNPFRYCGEYFDKETGTYYLRARYYDPSIGRFTQQDTHWNVANMIYGDNPQKINESQDALGLKAYTYAPSIGSIMQSGNLYVYCINNPIKYDDYTGCFINTIVGAVVGGVFSAVETYLKGGSKEEIIQQTILGALSGAATGAIIDLTVATGGVGAFAVAALGCGFVNATSGAVSDYISSTDKTNFKINGSALAVDFALGATSGMLSFGLAGGTFEKVGGNIFKNAYNKGMSTVFDGATTKVSISQSYNYTVVPRLISSAINASGRGTMVWTKSVATKILKNISYEVASSTITEAYFKFQKQMLLL